MTKDEVCSRIREIAIIPAIRVSSGDDAHFAAEAVTRGGIPIVEITMTVPGAVELMAHLIRSDPKLIVGAGTVLDTDVARVCVDAGVSFVTAPSLNPAILEFAAKNNVAVLPGALTPTEVVTAWSAGADFVKVFPCGPVGGDRYISALHASLPQIPLIAAGGVNQQTAGNFILSGATAIGVGTELIPNEAIKRRQSQRIHELARRFIKLVKDAREQIEAWKRSQVVKEFTGTEKCEK
ncbi:MAG TPA: bifunctional 4-hydroxy-2-oxoglutarate aldolase/2-dehydro-3-deoxy-phosphogluconate aldolase [Candidatus Eremiobacteraceae bacterium]|nr:bifunctional 4-hydroxy-2-oxoglutarate aldolase/2-dehydro-3-deoxy-phosphogluconate aldolase [Candidatus Eremiobacteraceae bacterium]